MHGVVSGGGPEFVLSFELVFALVPTLVLEPEFVLLLVSVFVLTPKLMFEFDPPVLVFAALFVLAEEFVLTAIFAF